MTQCYSTGTVSGSGAAGLVGSNEGTVTHCYGTGVVAATTPPGWPSNNGTVAYCYSTGAVKGNYGVGGLVLTSSFGAVMACFWDTQTSGQATSAGGTGKTTAEMQTGNTFLNAGWDFVGETKNGTEDIWWILEGKDYPRLWWEAARTSAARTAFAPSPGGRRRRVSFETRLSWIGGAETRAVLPRRILRRRPRKRLLRQGDACKHWTSTAGDTRRP